MVIQSNMPVAGIVSAWPTTEAVFNKYGIEITISKPLNQVIPKIELQQLINELNNTINSSNATCIEGG